MIAFARLIGFTLALVLLVAPLHAQPADDAQPRLVVQTGGVDGDPDLALSPTGEVLVSIDGSNQMALWDVATGRALRMWTFEDGYAVDFSPDGTSVVASNRDVVQLWDVYSGRPTVRIEEGEESLWRTDLAFLPDGRLATAAMVNRWDGPDSYVIDLHDAATGARVRRLHTPVNTHALAVHPTGRWLAAAGTEGLVHVWDLEAETSEPAHTLKGGDRSVLSVLFSPGGMLLAAASQDRALRLWRTESWEPTQTIEGAFYENEISAHEYALTFTPDGRHILTPRELVTETEQPWGTHRVAEDVLSLWEIETGALVAESAAHQGYVLAMAVSDRALVTAGSDAIRIWDLTGSGTVQEIEDAAEWVKTVRAEADGTLLARQGPNIHRWNLADGRLHERWSASDVKAVVVDTVRGRVLLGEGLHVRMVDLATGADLWRTLLSEAMTFRYGATGVALDPAGKWALATAGARAVHVLDAETGDLLGAFDAVAEGFYANALALSPDGMRVVVMGTGETGYEEHPLAVFRLEPDRRGVRAVPEEPFGEAGSAVNGDEGAGVFSPNGRLFAGGDPVEGLHVWEVEGRRLRHQLDGARSPLLFSPDGRFVAGARGWEGDVGLWDSETGTLLHTLSGHTETIETLSFTPDGRHLVSGSRDNTARTWRVDDGREVARLLALKDGSWVVLTPDGRFDTNDLERIAGVHWVMPDDPLTPLALETFMQDFYEPRLLPRVLAGETLPEAGSLLERNRVQPAVEINSVVLAADGTATATVEVEGLARGYGGEMHESGAHDLRLFRDGQLIAWADGVLVEGTGRRAFTFDGLALPSSGSSATDTLTFSAYAFNGDRVKSRTAYAGLAVPDGAVPARERRAYVVSLGVDAFADSAWDLRFAANDAHAFQDILKGHLDATGDYAEVVAVSLVAAHDEAASTTATAAALRAVLARLAGEPGVDADAQLAAVPNADRIREATPDDLVIITASTHGYADEHGVFYLLPEDIPVGGGRTITPALLDAAISSDDLTAWLRGVDAGTLALVVDACHAAAAVEGTDFKPGPMGSRGLGQLAFDKGMRVLTATQADDVALESASLAQGLLSFALVRNGLLARQADTDPADGRVELGEWLRYGVARVPSLYEEVRSGSVETFGEGRSDVIGAPAASVPVQRPSLFDFTRGRSEIVLVGASIGPR